MIDFHMHVGRLTMREPLTPKHLLEFMDKNGIEKAVLLPIENPEETCFYVTTDEVLKVCKQHPDRFIPFCNVDPRRGWPGQIDFSRILEEYKDRGCVGFGEVLAGVPMDDPRLGEIFDACDRFDMPVVLDMNHVSCRDEVGLPRLERVLNTFPGVKFIGHGPHFWAEISGDVKPEHFADYPTGPVVPGGAAPRLLAEYPNMYADLSAMSGYLALIRDMDYGFQFLERFRDKLLFGTDLLGVGQDVKIVDYFKQAMEIGKISRTAYERIGWLNAEMMLGSESKELVSAGTVERVVL